MMGLPVMNPAAMISMMSGLPVAAGWLMPFAAGIVYAMAYAYFFINMARNIMSNSIKGVLFGISVFIFAQVMIAVMGALSGGMPPVEGSKRLTILGSIIGHVVFGIGEATIVKDQAKIEYN